MTKAAEAREAYMAKAAQGQRGLYGQARETFMAQAAAAIGQEVAKASDESEPRVDKTTARPLTGATDTCARGLWPLPCRQPHACARVEGAHPIHGWRASCCVHIIV